MIRCILAHVVILLLLWTPQLMAYQGSLVGSGARAMGMGGAFIAVADDATAISWNPAGLTRLDEPEAGLSLAMGSGGWSVDLPPYVEEELSYDIDEESSLSLNFASGVVPFKIGERHAVAALGYRKYWDNTQKTTYTSSYHYGMIYDSYIFDKEVEGSDNVGAVVAISPSLGVQLSPSLSVGATISMMTGSFESQETQELSLYGEQVHHFASESRSKYSGFTADFGVLVDITPRIRAGGVVSLPWTLSIKEGEARIQDQDWQSIDDIEQDLPAFFGAGIAIKPSPPLTLALDVRHHPWSKVKFDGEDSGWEDATVVRTGLEYLLIGESSVIPLRAGFYSEPLNSKDMHDDQIKTNAFTIGGGLILGKLTVDLCYVRATTKLAGAIYSLYTIESPDDKPVITDHELTENLFTISGVIHLGPSEE